MKLGIISDTHDNVENILKAVKVFKERSVELVIHCGDVIAPVSVGFFEGLKVWFMKGNCDGDVENITRFAEKIGGKFLGVNTEFKFNDKFFGVVHGNNKLILEKMINSETYDYVLHGHTHKKRDEIVGKTRVINPGSHYYGDEGTIAILDVSSDKLEFVKL
ncbi:MAG: YfcE family phosphodiesterase [Nanoarchaeota archaeon]|nr:YfcE family phosphodiesterase [Nanoarchaeota archaeon]MBU1030107.1 YfcE family phosphodiesterase [Nanoarchaeota archaeon]MBU1849990.1 YfcE family phosphodiesterase [Nanoarchaeota archaeon]